jgi:hypothetical protein
LFEESLQARDNLHASITLQQPFPQQLFIQLQILLMDLNSLALPVFMSFLYSKKPGTKVFIGFSQRMPTLN